MIDPIQMRNRGIVTTISLLISIGVVASVFVAPKSWASYVLLLQILNLALLFNLGKFFPNSRP